MATEAQKKYWESLKGKPTWNKGVPMSEEAKKKASNSKKGQVPWNKGKKCPYVTERNLKNNPGGSGVDNPNWQGGGWTYAKRIVLDRDNNTCQECGLRDIEIMQVDHIIPRANAPERGSDIENMVTLCPNCHARKSIRERKTRAYGRWSHRGIKELITHA